MPFIRLTGLDTGLKIWINPANVAAFVETDEDGKVATVKEGTLILIPGHGNNLLSVRENIEDVMVMVRQQASK